MTESVGEALIELRADVSRLEADMNRAGQSGGKRFAGAFSGAMKGLVLGAAAGVVGKFIGDSIAGASDLGETVAKTGVVFGKASDDIVKFASSGAAVLGQSKQAALDAASTFGVFGKAAGLSGRDLSSFSTDLVSLSADLASFHNAEPEEVVEALGAALRGESEPMRRFGVLLDDASLRAEALKQGLVKTTKEALTPQQKTLAAQALILRQTADAQGDFARTSDGLANKQRIAAAAFEDLRTRLGGAFLPAATAVVGVFVTLLDKAEALGPVFSAIGGFISNAFSGLSGGGLLSNLSSFLPTLQALGGSLLGFVQGLLPTLQSFGSQLLGVLGPALTQIGGLIKNQLVPAFQAVLPVLLPVARFLLTVFGGAVIGAVKGVVKVLSGLITFISGVFNIIAGLFTGDWPRLWQGLGQVVSGAFQAIIGVIQVVLNVGILGLFRKGIAAIRAIWTGLWSGLKSIATSAGGAVRGAFQRVITGIGNLIVRGVTGYINLWRGALRGIVAVVRNALAVLRSAFGGALAALRTLVSTGLARIRAFFTQLGPALRNAAVSAFQRVRSAFSNGITAAVNLVKSLPGRAASLIRNGASQMLSAGRQLIEGLARGVAEKIDAVVDKVKAGLGKIKGLLPGSPIKYGPLLSWNNGGAGKRLMGMLASGIDADRSVQRAMSAQTRRVAADFARITAGSGAAATFVTDPFPTTPAPRPAGGYPGVAAGANVAFNVMLPTGDPEAAAQRTLDRFVTAGIF